MIKKIKSGFRDNDREKSPKKPFNGFGNKIRFGLSVIDDDEKCLRRNLIISFTACVMGAVSLMIIPLTKIDGDIIQRFSAYFTALIFWGSIAVETTFSFLSKKARARIIKKLSDSESEKLRLLKAGIISFFKNREAIAADITFFCSIIFVLTSIIFELRTQWLILSSVSLLFVSFSLHSILNGQNYIYCKEYKNRRIKSGEEIKNQ